MSDEGFHEIQLNGKQLVFLFMAATVVSVVIFLCGVLVGRGARPEPAQAADATTAAVAPDPGPLPEPQVAVPPTVEPPAPADEFSYAERLQSESPPAETLKAAPPAVPVVPAVTDAPQVPPQPPPAVSAAPASSPGLPSAAAADSSGPANAGFVVQVAALRDRGDADVIVKRLIGKGYPAYVLAPAKGAPAPVFRVQVGKFSNLRQADETAARLEKEEHFKPWIRR